MIAVTIASSHERIRLRSPMLIQSETAPMVQKFALLAIAPNTSESPNAHSNDCVYKSSSI